MLKYASNIDQVLQLGWLTRERFLAGWFVLFTLAGLYLLGLLKLEGNDEGDHLGIGRLLTASLFLIFAFSLLPGMFGAPLGELDAYVPAATGGIRNNRASTRQVWMKNQYQAGARSGACRKQTGAGDFHRLCLHELPLDESQHVPAP